MRRYVYVTPKSYLSFIELYKELYKTKYDTIYEEESNISKGLERLAEANRDVELLKEELKKEDIKLNEAKEASDKLLKVLDVENKKASIKGAEVEKTAESCMQQKEKIEVEKEEANKDLQAALPYLRKAEAAVKSINKNDIDELKGTRQPADICKIIMDATHILFMQPLIPVSGPKGVKVMKNTGSFINDSYEDHTKRTLVNSKFLGNL